MVHIHILHYAPLLHIIEFGDNSILLGFKMIAQANVVNVIKSLQQQFLDLKLFNAAKLFNSIYFSTNLTLFY